MFRKRIYKKAPMSLKLGQTFTVEDKSVVHNEKLPVYKITGKVTRTGANTPEFPGLYTLNPRSLPAFILRDLLGDVNRFITHYVQ